VYVVDDDASFLLAISRLLRASGFMVKAFSVANDFLAQLAPGARGCLIADLQMPGMSGMDLQMALAGTENIIPVIFLTGHGDIPTTVQAMRRGAEDFLSKRADKEQLLDAVNRALARGAREQAERERLRKLREPFAALTPRDREVLAHVLTGQLNKQIAADLQIDERSVKRHRASIMTKLHVQSLVELTHLIHEAGLSFSVHQQTTPNRQPPGARAP
jgi:FixJ family two-component response regulator